MAPVTCIEDDEINCERQDACVTVILWKKIDEAVRNVVDNTTLQDLLDWQQEKTEDYVI